MYRNSRPLARPANHWRHAGRKGCLRGKIPYHHHSRRSQNGRSVEPEEVTRDDAELSDGSSSDNTVTLVRNFLDCVKSRQTPICTLEDGHRSTCFAHLGNIALATKERLQWDPEMERFTNSAKANELLHYDYRSQWKMYGL